MKLTRSIKNSGFTTLEIILVVALIAIVAGATIGIYFSAKNQSDLDVCGSITTQYLRRAQTFSQAGKDDSEWSVKISNSEIILFKGNNYETRDTSFDEKYSFPISLNHSGIDEITFSKLLGIPSITGDIIFQERTNKNLTISINSKGIVNY